MFFTPPLLAFNSLVTTLMFLVGCALLTSILLRRTYKYFGGKRTRGGSGKHLEQLPRPSSQWDGAYRDSSAQIERQKVELYELSREANGQLTTKIAILEQLVSTSSDQIKQMEQLLAELREAKQEVAVSERVL